MARERNEETYNVGKKVINESDLEFQVNYHGEVFTLKYPNPFERSAIEADIARHLGGYSRESFPSAHVTLVEATAYVNALVVRDRSPKWWRGAWVCYDEELIYDLYRGYLQFREKFQERFRED